MAKAAWYEEIWDVINGARTSVSRGEDNITRVNDAARFRGLSSSDQELVNDLLEEELKSRSRRCLARSGQVQHSLKEVRDAASALAPVVLNSWKSRKPLTRTVMDSIYRGSFGGYGGSGYIANAVTMNGVPGQDPATSTYAVPNIWISPHEAAAIYSQKGIPETIINKKGKSVMLNGLRFRNPLLTPEQLDAVYSDSVRNGFLTSIVEAAITGLVYGGSLMFPFYRQDSPLSAQLPVHTLARQGIIGKGKISRWVTLDRWNTVHIPDWNPVSEDFRAPKKYYIPFMGADVNGERCARIVTAAQPGYYGVIMTMGWGISDIPGWIQSVYNYYSVMASIPTMINQMSIVLRTFDVDGPLATEGMNMLDDIDWEDTIHFRETSVNNPISMDVVGNVQSIQRDFKEVPALVRLLRQDVGGRANIAEELLWSSERGAFSSGDTTEGALEKLWENNKYIHRDMAAQLRNVVQLEVINALGLDRDVIKALPYTTVEFDNPALTDAYKKSEFFRNMSEGILDTASATVPMHHVVRIAENIGETDYPVGAELMRELKERQDKIDAQADEKFRKDMELMDAQVSEIRERMKHIGEAGLPGGGSGGSVKKPEEDGGYSRLEQKRHEKTRGTQKRMESMARRRNGGSGI